MTRSPSPRPHWRILQLALTTLVVGFAAWYLWTQWSRARETPLDLQLRWMPLVASSVVVLITYAVLIETWRRVLTQLGAPVRFGPAAHVWFVSNLGKYVPGKIWQLSAMTVMLGQHGVSLAVAGASAVVITIANVATGLAIVLLFSVSTVRQLAGGSGGVIAATLGLLLCLVAAPLIARQWNRLALRLGREQLSVAVPMSAVWTAIVGCAVSWIMYGIAFRLFVHALIGPSGAPLAAFITAYATSYLVGYLALFAPGGIGAREVVLAGILVPLGIASAPQAVVITVASRLWLTVLEIAPSVAALALGRGPISRGEAGSRNDRGTPPAPP